MKSFGSWKPLAGALAAVGISLAAACSSDGTTTTQPVEAGANCGTGSQLCGDGCTVLARDPQNCGACGKACAAGEVCSQGSCAASCGGGTSKCGAACADTKSDAQNCGACGTACKSGEVCSAGKCALSCGGGTKQCGSSCVNTQNDPTNCGGCGVTCGGGQTCSAGTCTLTCQPGLTMCTAAMSDAGAPDAASSDASSDAAVDAAPMLGSPYCANLQSDNLNCGSCGNVCTVGQCVGGACAYSSCSAALAAGVKNSGIVWINPNGVAPFQAYCDMTTDGGGWTLIVLTNGNVAGFPDVTFAEAKNTSANVNGSFGSDLDSFDFIMGTTLWNAAGPGGKMLFKVGDNKGAIKDVVRANFNVYGNSERITWNTYTAIQGGIPNIDYNNNGFLQAKDAKAAGSVATCIDEQQPGVGLWGPWFYQGCSNVSPWCTGHGDCNGQPVRMQWRNQSNYTTATANHCSNHGEIYVR